MTAAMLEVLKAIAMLALVGALCFWVGFRLGRTFEFYYLKRPENRHELDE